MYPHFRPNVPDHGFDALLESCRVVVVWQWWFQRADFFRCTAWQFSVAQELIPGSNDFASCQGCEEDLGAQLLLRQLEQVSATHAASSRLLRGPHQITTLHS